MIIVDHNYNARIIRVIDGDTYDVEVDVGFRMLARMPLRVAEIDAPEHNTPEGQAATEAVRTYLGDLPRDVVVHTVKPVENYGRYLADVYVDEVNLGQWMVQNGHAKIYGE